MFKFTNLRRKLNIIWKARNTSSWFRLIERDTTIRDCSDRVLISDHTETELLNPRNKKCRKAQNN